MVGFLLLSGKFALMIFAGRINRIEALQIGQNFLGGKEIRIVALKPSTKERSSG